MARPAIYDTCMHLAIVEEVHNLLVSGICEQSNECTDVPKTLFKDGVLHFYYSALGMVGIRRFIVSVYKSG